MRDKSIHKWSLFISVILVTCIILFIKTPFMYNKLEEQMYDAEMNYNKLLDNQAGIGAQSMKSRGLSRFSGFFLTWEDLKMNPIIGYGGHFENSYSSISGSQLTSPSGWGNWVSQFGIAGTILLLMAFYKSSTSLVKYCNAKFGIFVFVSVFFFFVGFNLLDTPIFFIYFLYNCFGSGHSMCTCRNTAAL